MSECVGCGFCCRQAPCDVARRTGQLDENGRCKLLRWNGERYLCAIMVDPFYNYVRVDYIKDLAIGAGCCCSFNTDRQNIPSPEECGLTVPDEPDIHWRRVVQVIGRALAGGFMLTGDTIFLTARSIEHEFGPELGPIVAEEFLRAARENVTKSMKGFMG